MSENRELKCLTPKMSQKAKIIKKKKNSPYILYIYEHMKGMLNEIPGFYFCCFEVCWNKFSSMS